MDGQRHCPAPARSRMRARELFQDGRTLVDDLGQQERDVLFQRGQLLLALCRRQPPAEGHGVVPSARVSARRTLGQCCGTPPTNNAPLKRRRRLSICAWSFGVSGGVRCDSAGAPPPVDRAVDGGGTKSASREPRVPSGEEKCRVSILA